MAVSLRKFGTGFDGGETSRVVGACVAGLGSTQRTCGADRSHPGGSLDRRSQQTLEIVEMERAT
jgi:hypothetical protein